MYAFQPANHYRRSMQPCCCACRLKQPDRAGEDWFRAGTGGGTATRKSNGGRFSLSPELDNELEDISGDEDDLHYSHRHEPK